MKRPLTKRVGVFYCINTRLVMEILLILISSPLKLITISCMRYSLPRIIFRYHLSTASLLIVYWVLSREEEQDTTGIILQLSQSRSVREEWGSLSSHIWREAMCVLWLMKWRSSVQRIAISCCVQEWRWVLTLRRTLSSFGIREY